MALSQPALSNLLEPRRRIDQALYAVVMKAYVHAISTRSVDDLVVALGADSGISKSEVSRICEQLDESVGARQGISGRRLEGDLVAHGLKLPDRAASALGVEPDVVVPPPRSS